MADRRWNRFAKQLKHHRARTDLSQTALARSIHVGESTIAAYETGRRAPNRSTAEALDRALSAGGSILQVWDELTDEREIPEDWRDFEKVEQQASTIREYHATLIPGLLQTRDYALMVLRNTEMWSEEQVERLAAARAARLDNLGETALTFVVDEVVLRRGHGSWDILRVQLDHILTLVDTRRIRLLVIPQITLFHPSLAGSFRVMTLWDGRLIGHEEYLSGVNVVTGPRVDQLVTIFGHLQGEALSLQNSVELLKSIREEL